MKKLLILSAAFAIIACKETPNVDYAIINGTVSNFNGNTKLTINTPDGSVKEDLMVAQNGTFTDTLNANKSLYALYDGKTPVYLYVEPGFNLNINYDLNDVQNTLIITGKGSEINNYLIAKRKLEGELFGNPRETYKLEEADYKAKINSVKDGLTNLLNKTANLSKEFIAKESRNINYFYLKLHDNYENIHRTLAQNPTFKVSDDFLSELKNIDYTNAEDFKYSTTYKSLVSAHYGEKAQELSKKDGIEYDIAYLQTIAPITNTEMKNALAFEFANSYIGRSGDVEAFYTLFKKNSTNEENNAIITEKYNSLMALAKGKPSPAFTDYVNYEGGKTSLADLKGKYVYVDVWATWCGPCKREIPFLKEVEEKFHDKNIEFVSISIDQQKDFEKWKSMVAEKELKGVQLFADNDWKSSFVQDYQINGIPRFILIDPNGNIVNPNAPRPSSPALTELFTSLDI